MQMVTMGIYTLKGKYVRQATRDEYKRSLSTKGQVVIDGDLYQVKQIPASDIVKGFR